MSACPDSNTVPGRAAARNEPVPGGSVPAMGPPPRRQSARDPLQGRTAQRPAPLACPVARLFSSPCSVSYAVAILAVQRQAARKGNIGYLRTLEHSTSCHRSGRRQVSPLSDASTHFCNLAHSSLQRRTIYLSVRAPTLNTRNRQHALFCRVECVRHKLRARSLRLGWHHRSK